MTYHLKKSGRKIKLKWMNTISWLLFLICRISHVAALRRGRLMSPTTFVALSGDLHVQIQFNSSPDQRNMTSHHPTKIMNSTIITDRTTWGADMTTTLVISKLKVTNESNFVNGSNRIPQQREIVQSITLYPDPRNNVTQIALACNTFYRGGLYELNVLTTNANENVTYENLFNSSHSVLDERLSQILDVRWPNVEMIVSPQRLTTYPEAPVNVVVRFKDINCDKIDHIRDLPEFWLELVYCGEEKTCTRTFFENSSLPPSNSSSNKSNNLLYAEEIRGFPREKIIKLRCDLFGLAGNYIIQMRPIPPTPENALSSDLTKFLVQADWSDKFVFNVYARSIFPCDPHTGIGVLYEYPACILEQGDRVRVYAKLRADVASLKPPTSLHYVAEQRVVKNQYSLHFSCDLFSEKYIEYCFVYVSQAISGAVADVRMDCVPTLPVKESDTGGWGPWSEWTACSTSCLGGTRNRYRFCDSPPPRYGAKFCEGSSVETENCGKSTADTWDCIYESGGKHTSNVDRNELIQEIGPGCRCGCIVHLGLSKRKRIIAGATKSCPGRSFWLIQVESDEGIRLDLKFLRLPCTSQYIKIRDGPSLSSSLLLQLNGGSNPKLPVHTKSNSAHILVEFYAGDNSDQGRISVACIGGFLANVEQIAQNSSTNTMKRKFFKNNPARQPKFRADLKVVHLSAVVFASIIIIISALLGFQYIVRYRKYHLAIIQRNESGSHLHTPRASIGSLHLPPSRAISTTTLLSEVIYLVKMRPKHQLRHSILRESLDADTVARETEFNDDLEHFDKCHEEFGSNSSIITLRKEMFKCSHEEYALNEPAVPPLSPTVSIVNGTSSDILSPTSKQINSRKIGKIEEASVQISNDTMNGSIDNKSLQSLPSESSDMSHSLDARSILNSNSCYSPANCSMISTSAIWTTNQKESKDKLNRKKLLARPTSDFSLTNPEDLELDYYDYNVINAGAAPGSYLGMDPAYLIWIPPMDDAVETDGRDSDKTPEPEPIISEPMYNDILPKYSTYLKSGSTTLSSEEVSSIQSIGQSTSNSPTEIDLKKCLNHSDIVSSSEVPSMQSSISEKSDSCAEKETAVVKSITDLHDFYALEDIRFVDEESDHDPSSKMRSLANSLSAKISCLKEVQ